MKKHTYIEIQDIGEMVRCDVCNEDWTGRKESGGFLFGSYAYCPDCAKSHLPKIRGYGELDHIKAWCPPEMSFAQWCIWLRNGDNTIRTITRG